MRLLALLAAGLFAGSLLAADDKKDKPKDEEAILGKWQVEKFDTGDPAAKPFPADVLAKWTMTFTKDGKMINVNASGTESKTDYKHDSTAKPKSIDVSEAGKTTPGIYEFDGDSLKICISKGKTRPTEFKADGKETVVFTLKRVKDEKKDK